jgi:hypothetical protein
MRRPIIDRSRAAIANPATTAHAGSARRGSATTMTPAHPNESARWTGSGNRQHGRAPLVAQQHRASRTGTVQHVVATRQRPRRRGDGGAHRAGEPAATASPSKAMRQSAEHPGIVASRRLRLEAWR